MRYRMLSLAVVAVIFGVYFFAVGFQWIVWEGFLPPQTPESWLYREWFLYYAWILSDLCLLVVLSAMFGLSLDRSIGMPVGTVLGLLWGAMSFGAGLAFAFWVSFLLALGFSLACTWMVLDVMGRLVVGQTWHVRRGR